MYNNNHAAINDGLKDDKGATPMEEEEFEEVEIMKVVEE